MKQKTKKKFIFITAVILMGLAILAYVMSMDEEENPVFNKLEKAEVPDK